MTETNKATNFVPTHPVRFASIGVLALLALLLSVASASAQTPAPAAPTNLAAELTDTEGEVQLTWDAAEGATSYRVCQRTQQPAGAWSCVLRTTTNALFTGLASGTTYDFAVASYDGETYSEWVWTELTVRTSSAHICPITGLAIPEGYLSVNEKTTASSGREFTLTSITRKSTIRSGSINYNPFDGRAFVKVCGKVKAGSTSTAFIAGYFNNLSTEDGIGFVTSDDGTTDWLDVGVISANQTRSACDVWEVPEDADTIIYAVYNSNDNDGVYKVDLPEE